MEVNKVVEANVSRLSLVEHPSNGANICSEISGCNIDNNTITATVLKSNDKIYRSGENGGNERYIYFDNNTVETMAHEFIADNKTNQLSINHGEALDDGNMQLLESYVRDGNWEVKMQLSDELIEDVKSGKLKGISLESPLAKEQTILDASTKNEFELQIKKLSNDLKNEVLSGLIIE